MPNRKLLEITGLLPLPQTKRLRQFLASPYFNHRYNALQIQELFDVIVQCGSDEQHPDLDKEVLSRRFFPEKTYRPNAKNTIDSLASDLFRLVKLFLSCEDLQEEEWTSREHLALARFYRKNSLEERFWQNIKQWRKTLHTLPYRNAAFHLQQFYLEDEVAAFRSIYNTYSDDANLQAAHQHLDTFYTLLKLEFACALDFQRQFSQLDAREAHTLTRVLLQEYPGMPYLQSPLTEMYMIVLQLLEDPNNADTFSTFERQLALHKTAIEPVKYRNLQAFYRFFAGKQYVKYGGKEVLSRLFKLYKKHLQEGYFYVDGKLLPASLKILVNIALKLDQPAWVEQFLEVHTPDMLTGTRFPVESHSLCVAELLFYQQAYTEAREHLVFRHFENINYSILADILLIKIYYETDDELLDSRMKALMQKVRRARISAESKAPYLNFLKKLDKINRYGWQKKSRKISALEQEVRTLPAILEREWLLKIIAENSN